MKKGLGKGLGALISDSVENENEEVNKNKQNILEVDINKVEPNKDQPRKLFNEEDLEDLAASISEFGIIQPIIVTEENGFYSIVAGERRWRAARIAKLKNVPVVIKKYDKTETLQVALVENIQRRDLNPIEEAKTYKRLMDEFFFTQEDIGSKVGRGHVSISNTLSLLNLDSRVQNLILLNKLSVSVARILLTVENSDLQFELADKIADENLNASAAQLLVNSYLNSSKSDDTQNVKTENSYHKNAVKDLRQLFGTNVNIKQGKQKSKIEIEFNNDDELDRLMLLIKKIEK